MELTDLRLYQTCPILYEHRDELNLSDLKLHRVHGPSEEITFLTEVVRRAVLICCRRMFSAEKKYDRKKVEKIWRTAFHSVFCPDEETIPESLAKAYNRSLIVLHKLYPWLDSFEGRIIGINLPLTVAVYGKQMDVEIPLVLAANEGISLVFLEEMWGDIEGRLIHDPVIRFSCLGVSENVNRVGKIIVLGAALRDEGAASPVPALGSFEFIPPDKYWQLACRDFASLVSAIDQNLLYPNLRHCSQCPRRSMCSYPNIERND